MLVLSILWALFLLLILLLLFFNHPEPFQNASIFNTFVLHSELYWCSCAVLAEVICLPDDLYRDFRAMLFQSGRVC